MPSLVRCVLQYHLAKSAIRANALNELAWNVWPLTFTK